MPVILVAALFLRARNPELFRPRRRESLIAQFKALTPRQRVHATILVVGFFAVLIWGGLTRRMAQIDMLRSQFNIPEDVAVTSVRTYRWSTPSRPQFTAIATFSQEQLQAYVATLDDTSLWRPALQAYGDIPVASYSPDALRWTTGPVAATAGQRRIRIGRSAPDSIRFLRDSRVMCFALQGRIGDRAVNWSREQPDHYVAKGCSEFDRDENVGKIVLGILDMGTGLLHVSIR
ncbi:MAG: hypothetical protein R3D68_09975 [Hyphomicrobiaceae bacterium]